MPDVHQLLLFIAAGWLLNLTPGPDVLFIVSSALRSGVRAGIVAGLGITAGCFVHVFSAALGLGALLATSATAFTLLKWLGAAYLLWVGFRMLFSGAPQPSTDFSTGAGVQPNRTLRQVFMGGFLTNVLNPKVAIFFLAFVPQFIAPDTANKALAFVWLGVLFNLNAIAVNLGWAMGAAWLSRRGAVQRGMHWLDRVAAVMFIGFGIKLTLSDNPAR
ncbi:MAG: Lysine exporter protein [Polaromonas sp.]|jgi:RhtB (resistance to homoserine/threonine) family protein|nr:Lysine exporter protein [Polaromonas sp.]